MTTDRRVSASPASPWPASADFRARASARPSWCAAPAYAALMLGWAWVEANTALAVYGLSFWHYYLYWLAYSFGAVSPREFRRDAVTWKTTALVALGAVYFAALLNLLSLCVVSSGFLLNCLAARALGTERTYYGCELVDLPPLKITAFPYSWIGHPMLVGNMAAFGGTLLNADFRRAWWPLAVAHIVLNLGLLVMELAVTPERRNARQPAPVQSDSRTRYLQPADYFITVAVAIITGIVAWNLESPHPLLVSAAAASISIYALALFRKYTATPAAPSHRETVLETIE
jgi:Phospholipid methyltransferase